MPTVPPLVLDNICHCLENGLHVPQEQIRDLYVAYIGMAKADGDLQAQFDALSDEMDALRKSAATAKLQSFTGLPRI